MSGRAILVVALVGCLLVPVVGQPVVAGQQAAEGRSPPADGHSGSDDGVSGVTNATFELTADVTDLALGDPTDDDSDDTVNATTTPTAASNGTNESAAGTNASGATAPTNGSDDAADAALSVPLGGALNGTLLGDGGVTEPLNGNELLVGTAGGTDASGESERVENLTGETGVATAVTGDDVVLVGPLFGVDLGVVTVESVSLDGLLSMPLQAILDEPSSNGDAVEAPTAATPELATPEPISEPAPADGGPEAHRGDGERNATSAAQGGEDPGGAGDGPDGSGSGVGTGAALFVVVGCLGGAPLAANQSLALGPLARRAVLDVFRQAVGLPLVEFARRVAPIGPFVGYSRRDDSDPLANETRAAMFDIVEDSPGTYYAQLASETGVTEETVRYHARVLEEEGLVERCKLRGRQRLYPVTVDGGDPELDAAMADAATSKVLGAIERREPTTLSALAEALDCAPSTVSYHLDRLESDALVDRERDGGSVRVRLRVPTRSKLQASVADD